MLLPAAQTYTDRELLEGIRRRDNAVLSALYQLYRPGVNTLVIKQGGTEQEAKDVLQEAIIAVFINLQRHDFQFLHSFDAYFHGICQKQWLKKFRDKSRRSGVSLDTPEGLNIAAEASAGSEYAERQRFVMEKFRSLPDGCRELLRLSVIEGKMPEEIAEQLGFGSLNYFYKRKSRCKDKLEALVRSDPHFDQY